MTFICINFVTVSWYFRGLMNDSANPIFKTCCQCYLSYSSRKKKTLVFILAYLCCYVSNISEQLFKMKQPGHVHPKHNHNVGSYSQKTSPVYNKICSYRITVFCVDKIRLGMFRNIQNSYPAFNVQTSS